MFEVLPDVAKSRSLQPQIPLEWVGMRNIHLPVKFLGTHLHARFSASVDLPGEHRGIHMSRIYAILNQEFAGNELSSQLIEKVHERILQSQSASSKKSKLEIYLELAQERASLVSGHSGYRIYPVNITSTMPSEDGFLCKFELIYSSTCPASAALSRTEIAAAFEKKFSQQLVSVDLVKNWLLQEEALAATPHAQRSVATLEVAIKDLQLIPSFLSSFENRLSTVVQTLVKREDELEFAKRNAQNLMFCEDAARKLAGHCQELGIRKYFIEVKHLESLHPHDAVAVASN
jgi:GTP cyclohydrolase I